MKIIISLLIIIFLSSPILCYGATETELKTSIESIQTSMDDVHDVAEQLRDLGYEEESEELLALKSIWATLKNENNQLEQELEEKEREKAKGRYLGTFVTTAYCYQCSGSITSTGVRPVVGTTIAVDPRVIPYGSTLRLEDMNGNFLGYRIAQDTGGAIKGQRLDIYLNNDAECQAWGRRNINVFIVE